MSESTEIDKIKVWYSGLSFMDKLLIGIGGAVSAAVAGAIAVTVIAKGTKTNSKGFAGFQKGTAVVALGWNIVDPIIKGFSTNAIIEKFRYWIDQGIDVAKILASSDKLSAIFSGE